MRNDSRARKRSAARTVFYNVLIFFVAFNVLYWAIPTISSLSLSVQLARRLAADVPAGSSVTQAVSWIADNWSATGLPPAVYRSHVGWRRVAWAREGVNVEGPYLQRRTLNDGTSGDAKVYFFGGSTIWGDGVPDGGTIPSLFAAKTGLHSENFGDLGYTAHQSLSLLIQLLQDGHRPKLVVFYDGVNEIWVKCRAELNPNSHEREQQFDTILRRSSKADSFSYYFVPFLALADNMRRELDRSTRGQEYDCHRNPQKAQAIVDKLIKDWEFARQLVEWHGGKFVGVLQPVFHFSRTPATLVGGNEMSLIERLQPEYEKIYPMLRERVVRAGGDFYDMVSAVDGNDPVYTDFCHLTPQGNGVIAQRIAEIAVPLGVGPPR